MAAANSTPLIAVDAFVIDTETTGLEAAKAHVVEIAAVPIVRGRVQPDSVLRELVQPGIPIPTASTKIHGIDDSRVADAPPFAAIWPRFQDRLGDGVVIGHAIGFDLAVLARECSRAGIAWRPGPSLDTRLLGQIAAPDLAGHSLEGLAAWLGVELTDRHTAAGDAVATARIFEALLPRLRERGVRTLGEALRSSDALAQALGLPPDLSDAAGRPESASRIDTYPYRRKVASIMRAPVLSAAPAAPLSAALDVMARERVSSVLIAAPGAELRPESAGIVTERDVLRAVHQHGDRALGVPLSSVMSAPLHTVPGDAFAYVAVGRMKRLKVRHLGVTGPSGEIAGMLSARDLLRVDRQEEIELGDEIGQAGDVHDLGSAWAKLAQVVRSLGAEGLSARQIAAVISQQLCEMTGRCTALAEQDMMRAGKGGAPCPYAFIVLGSAARGESLLAMDQDNALIYRDQASDTLDRWFAELGSRVADLLHEAGVPYCAGGIMAKNPPWRGSVAQWHSRVGHWMTRSSPEDLLAVDIFLDLRAVHGEVRLADDLRRFALEAARGQAGFAKLLLASAGSVAPGLNWFGGFRTAEGRIDLKKSGLFGIVSAARVVAVCRGIAERSTPARLAAIRKEISGSEADLDALDEAQALFLDLILDQQIEDLARGRALGNTVEVRRLTRRQREALRRSLRAVENLDDIAQKLLFAAPGDV